jgi:hypothetical protein
MNSIFKLSILILSFTFVFYSCAQQDDRKDEDEMNGDKTFASPEEAAEKAKRDLIELLETRKDLDMQIDAERLRNAEISSLVNYVEVDFTKLVNTDSVKSLSQISAGQKSMIAPFVLDNNVVATAEVGKVNDGWKVIGLSNPAITNDLNSPGIMHDRNMRVTLYEVPNLQVFIYAQQQDTTEKYFLNFENFDIREGVPLSVFYPVLHERAARFQREFGDRLQREKLVK